MFKFLILVVGDCIRNEFSYIFEFLLKILEFLK